jgi:nickel-dependent lactate racemase
MSLYWSLSAIAVADRQGEDMVDLAHQAHPVSGATQIGGPDEVLSDEEIRAFIHEQLASGELGGRSVCVLVPDGTRSGPLPVMVSAIHQALHGRAARLTVLVALGTHPAMDETALASHLGAPPEVTIVQHAWWDPDAFTPLGTIPAARIEELSEGRLRDALPVRINRAVVEHDVVLIVGPVFPHEVVGFSGGNKYLFPGVSGRELIDVSHWLGALITSAEIIGTPGVTPVRALIDEAASMVPAERLAFCVVTGPAGSLRSVAFGPPGPAWAAAADVSAQAHIRYLERPCRRVLSVLPERYGDMWTGAKGFYKVEPVVADGGQVVLYAPHIKEISSTHPEILQIGYHCRDYFVKQWDRFKDHHWSDLAHSTHLRGSGTFDPVEGEHLRVTVTLATGIPEKVVRAVGLDYIDPGQVDLAGWAADAEALVVPDAGEDLFRLRSPDGRGAGPARQQYTRRGRGQ